MKDQLLIRYLRLGWKEAYYAWSCNDVDYTPENFQLFALSAEDKVPIEPPVDLTSPPDMPSFGTDSSDANDGLSPQVTHSRSQLIFRPVFSKRRN